MEKTRGRPRSFDRDAALEQAMRLFWKNGYEATSLSALTSAMGISPPSLYAAFGDKEALFLEAIDRYSRGSLPTTEMVLHDGATAREAIATLLGLAAEQLVIPTHPLGCMVLTSVVTCDSHARDVLVKARAATESMLRRRIERGVRDGDVKKGSAPAVLAAFFMTVLEGMSLQARDGASASRLRAIGETALMAWPS